MKAKYIYLLVSCLVSTNLILLPGLLQSQTYIPLPDSNAIWRTNWSDMNCFIYGYPYSQYQYLLSSDTLINGTLYNKVIRTGFISPFCPPFSPYQPSIGYQGAYRNDIADQKVYLVLPDSTNEILLYDFSLEVGDTLSGYFTFPDFSPCSFLIVDSIEYIIINNILRKRMKITDENMCSSSYFIEGIGSSTGLLENLQSFEGGGELICFVKNDSILYHGNPFFECQIILSTESGFGDNPKIKVFPNPAQNYFIVEHHLDKAPKHAEIILIDGLGHEIARHEVKGRNNQEVVDTRMLKPSVYLVLLKVDGKVVDKSMISIIR